MTVDDRVVQLDVRVEHLVRIAAALPVALADLLVEQRRILRRVDLHVLAAEPPQLLDLAPREVDEIREIGIARRVGAFRSLGVVVGRRLLRAEQRHLHRRPGAAAQIGELLDRHLPPPLQLVDDHRPLETGLVPFAVAERDRPAGELVEAFERFDEMAVERIAAHLAVGDDVEPGRLLQRDGLVDGAVLDRLERRRRQLAALELLARVEQVLRPQQAADDVGAGGREVGWLRVDMGVESMLGGLKTPRCSLESS